MNLRHVKVLPDHNNIHCYKHSFRCPAKNNSYNKTNQIAFAISFVSALIQKALSGSCLYTQYRRRISFNLKTSVSLKESSIAKSSSRLLKKSPGKDDLRKTATLKFIHIYFFRTGNETVNVEPFDNLLSTWIRPLCSSIILLLIASPSPTPKGFFVTNGSNIFMISSG